MLRLSCGVGLVCVSLKDYIFLQAPQLATYARSVEPYVGPVAAPAARAPLGAPKSKAPSPLPSPCSPPASAPRDVGSSAALALVPLCRRRHVVRWWYVHSAVKQQHSKTEATSSAANPSVSSCGWAGAGGGAPPTSVCSTMRFICTIQIGRRLYRRLSRLD